MSKREIKEVITEDLALVRSAVAGKRCARRECVERMLNRVQTMIGYIVGNDRDAEDMVQTTMVEILRALPGYKGAGSLESWSDRIAVRTCMRLLKKRSSRAEIGFHLEGENAEPKVLLSRNRSGCREGSEAVEVTVEKHVMQRRIRRRLASLLGELPPRRRAVVTLRWVFDYRPAEIAEITDTSVNTVRDHLQRGKRRFREMILEDEALREWLKEYTEAQL